jgi:SAM-dependent MidA family methyltransferase
MPVHLITNLDSNVQSVGTAGNWLERCIVESNDAFDFACGPIKELELERHLARIPHPRHSPYETEVNLAALRWIENLASKLVRGYVLTVDYGYSRNDFYAPDRSAGTIRFRARHGIIPSPFTGIGETDITAHVDWTSLAERAEAKGLSLAAFTDQHHFITGIVASLMRDEFDSRSDLGKSRALKTLLHPEFLGTSFQVLALSKDLPSGSSLNGFRFGRDPRVILGL